jgi:hypothetical protein
MAYPAQTTLQSSILAGSTSVTPYSLAGLKAPCYLVIETEIIFCPTAPVAGAFTGVTRGALQTTAASHAAGANTYGLFSNLLPFDGPVEYFNAIGAELATLEARMGAGGGALPFASVVTRFSFIDQTGAPLTVQLIPATAPSGIYLLCDSFELVTPDGGAVLNGAIQFNSPAGAVAGWTVSTAPTVNQSGTTSLGQLISQATFNAAAVPSVIDFVTGTAATAVFTFDTPTVLRYNYSGSVLQL